MMLFLFGDVVIDVVHLGMGIIKRSKSFLPFKLRFEKLLVIDKLRGIVFNIPNQIRNTHGRF